MRLREQTRRLSMKAAIIIISVLCFIAILPVSLIWGAAKGMWEEVEELALSLFVW